jgi:hypothetical protein
MDNHMTFIGKEELVSKTIQQSETFKNWAVQGQWNCFGPKEHFDWWAFPIDVNSHGYGDEFNIAPALEELRSDKQFLRAVLTNADLLMRAWGWDIVVQKKFADRYPNYGVRLWKCGHSLHTLGMPQAFESVLHFAELHMESQSITKWQRLSPIVTNPIKIDLHTAT